MARTGDRVSVKISGAVLHAAGDSSTVAVGRDVPLKVSGKILEDLGHSWLVELDMSIAGRNRIVVPKDAEVSHD